MPSLRLTDEEQRKNCGSTWSPQFPACTLDCTLREEGVRGVYKGKNSSPSQSPEREQQYHPHFHYLTCSWGCCCSCRSSPKSAAAWVWGHSAWPGAAVSAMAPFPCSCSSGCLLPGSVLQSCPGTQVLTIFFIGLKRHLSFTCGPCRHLRLCAPSPSWRCREIAVCSSGQTALPGPRD